MNKDEEPAAADFEYPIKYKSQITRVAHRLGYWMLFTIIAVFTAASLLVG